MKKRHSVAKIRNQLTPKILGIFHSFRTIRGKVCLFKFRLTIFIKTKSKRHSSNFNDENEEGFTLNKEILFRKPKVLIIEIIRKLGFTRH